MTEIILPEIKESGLKLYVKNFGLLKNKRLYSLKNKVFLLLLFLGVGAIWWFCLPQKLFDKPVSTVVYSQNGYLLGARIANDGQWRFPSSKKIPFKFEKAILQFEDAYFYKHPGFNPVAIAKAAYHNLAYGKRRGASTITQQVIRLSRGSTKRTYTEKLIEFAKALRLELRYSKKEILNFYASYAPFGGNVVGLETASWRYFGVSARDLSWGQAAGLAVLPNAPSLIFPGKNEKLLRQKRNRLLKKLLQNEIIDQATYQLALAEDLPQEPLALPDLAPHFVERIKQHQPKNPVTSDIDYFLQQQINQIAKQHAKHLSHNQIENLAILVLDVPTRKVIAYLGNQPDSPQDPYVDVIQQPRSAGSIFKPFLFTAALDEGNILPNTLLADIPTNINGYSPLNFDKLYRGAVPANDALAMSLNVPAVRLLQDYGVEKFYKKLKRLNQHKVNRPAASYGLSLTLGGAECSLWEVTHAYANMASTLNFYSKNSSTYRTNEFKINTILPEKAEHFGALTQESPVFGAGAIYHTFKALKKVNRPQSELNWQFYSSAQPIAWKTGTSHGFKDAWAVGVTPKYAVGIWVGNTDGEGRPGLTGVKAAAPIMFEVFSKLPVSKDFDIPYDDLIKKNICKHSGMLAGLQCPETEESYIPKKGEKTSSCKFHQIINLDSNLKYQVNLNCYDNQKIRQQSWLVLPTLWAYYYKQFNPHYKNIPAFSPECSQSLPDIMHFIFPVNQESILLPKGFNEKPSPLVLKLAHRFPEKEVYWYLNKKYMGKTKHFHEMQIPAQVGDYQLLVLDELSNQLSQKIVIQYN
ncbi:penicillin-binding protein 1C [uncultured Mesonia sp.]|uniref:penicillin-binding protein 1C n=1 Tax=uncultured Mesonia sp. TaxID=399731 RepID=UPI00374F5E70